MTKHTMGKLDVQNKGTLGTRSARHEIVEDGGKTVCKMPDLSDRSYEYAAEMVRRWNCHDGLLAALKHIAKLRTGPSSKSHAEWVARVLELAESARAAIAKVEENQ